jgi:Phosducin
MIQLIQVVVFMYHSSVEACRIVHQFMDRLANLYRPVKFTKILSTEADERFDNIALPAILAYQGGGSSA